jgi:hypothetical protein
VVKGAPGLLLLSFLIISFKINSRLIVCFNISLSFLSFDFSKLSRLGSKVKSNFSISSRELNAFVFHPIFSKILLKANLLCSKFAIIFHDSFGLKFCISLSLSTIIFTATDCTLQADNHFLIFFHNTGLTLYHTSLSRILLAC